MEVHPVVHSWLRHQRQHPRWNRQLGHETAPQRGMQHGRDKGQGAQGVGRGAQRQSPRCVAERRGQSQARAHGGHSSRWLPSSWGRAIDHGGHLLRQLLLLRSAQLEVDHVLNVWHQRGAGRIFQGRPDVYLRLVLRHLPGQGGASLHGETWVHASSDDHVSSGWGHA